MFKYSVLIVSLLAFQYCGPSETDIAIQRINSCLTWNTKQECERQLNMRVFEHHHTDGGSSFFFWHNGGYYYPYANSYYHMGSSTPTASQFNEMRSRYGANSMGNSAMGFSPSTATPSSRMSAVRYSNNSTPPVSRSVATRGGFGSSAGKYGGGIS